MIALTGCDPYSYRIESWQVNILASNILYCEELQDRGRQFSKVHLINGKSLIVRETLEQIKGKMVKT